MPKIAIIGAGSVSFAQRLITDCLSYPSMRDAEFSLIDINEKRLKYAGIITERIFREGGYSKASFSLHTDRREGLSGCDFIIICILAPGWQPIHMDIDIPEKYGVKQSIGDTVGAGGVFRMLRTAPHIVGMAHDIMELCPNAVVLNYTNPMSMLTRLACRAEPKIKWVGLCHSVQGTAHEWCERLGIPLEETNFFCAGINHLAWFLKFEHNGRDILPLIRDKALDPPVWKGDTTRCEYVKHFGHPVTESSGHNSEYAPWFRKREDLMERYCSPKNSCWNQTGFLKYFIKEGYGEDEMEKLINSTEPLNLTRSVEYGSQIMNAQLSGEKVIINGNVPNKGMISNFAEDVIVEVPIMVDKNGLQPLMVGSLPAPLAALDQANITVHEMAVDGYFKQDPELIFNAIAFDPLTSAVCSLDEIREMVAEMFEAEEPWLSGFPGKLQRKPQPWKTLDADVVAEKHADPVIDA